jgi:hypothetical protein
VDAAGRVWGWGWTSEGQLGVQAYVIASGVGAPVLMPAASAILQAAGGVWQSVLLRADGSVWQTPYIGGNPGDPSPAPVPNLTLAANTSLLTDADGDGLAAWEEYRAGTDPLNADSNGNGLSDLVDVRRGSASGNPDDDGDGVANALEAAAGTDPFRADTDGDGVSDRLDAYPLDPTRSQAPAPDPSDTTPPVIILTEPAGARPVGGQ